MDLPNDLVYQIKRKCVYNFICTEFDRPLQILSTKLVHLSIKFHLADHFIIDEDTLPMLAFSGHLEAIKWLYTRNKWVKPLRRTANYEADWSDFPIDMAAMNGHLEIMECLHFQGEPFTSFAMDYAAIGGYLPVVKWLQSHGAPCTTVAFDGAASAGNLEMLNWLKENRQEGFSSTVFKWNEDLQPHIYKFILKWYPHIFHPNLILNCAKRGDLETLEHLYNKNLGDWRNFMGTHPNGIRYHYTTLAFVEAGKRGHIQVVQWFVQKKLLV